MASYKGRSITVRYDAKRCIHAAECVHGLPVVFDPGRRPWIDPDGASVAELVDVIHRCPTGALRYERTDGGLPEAAPRENVIRVSADGPLYVHGDIAIEPGDGGSAFLDTRVALCRCGASQNKPFCDGSHEETGFAEPGALPNGDGPQASAHGGRLTFTLAPEGPLLLSGHFRLEGADRKSVVNRDKAALCRCGASANKPYCDGSHRRVGFKGA